jgi:hypothetical protein
MIYEDFEDFEDFGGWGETHLRWSMYLLKVSEALSRELLSSGLILQNPHVQCVVS